MEADLLEFWVLPSLLAVLQLFQYTLLLISSVKITKRNISDSRFQCVFLTVVLPLDMYLQLKISQGILLISLLKKKR